MERYKKIIAIGENGFSFCVKTSEELTDKEIVSRCAKAGLLSRDDIKECEITVVDITDDRLEMFLWKNFVDEI